MPRETERRSKTQESQEKNEKITRITKLRIFDSQGRPNIKIGRKGKTMNKIKFEFFNDFAEVSEATLDGTDQVELHFPKTDEGYLSIGPRIIKVEGGVGRFNLSAFGSGTHGCYLMINGRRIELPALEKQDRLFRMVRCQDRAELSRIAYLKGLEHRLALLEEDMLGAKEKIFGRKGII